MRSESAAADVFRRLALDERAKAYVLARAELYDSLYRAASRYVGGEMLDACLEVARESNGAGHVVTIDFMGESTRDCTTAVEATAEFIRIGGVIAEQNLDASVSLDLSHVGLVINERFCIDNASTIAEAAQSAGTEVMISAEGTDRTDAVLRVHEQLCKRLENVGVTVQAFLLRSPGDLKMLLDRPGKVRIGRGRSMPRLSSRCREAQNSMRPILGLSDRSSVRVIRAL